jgi:cytochrome P450
LQLAQVQAAPLLGFLDGFPGGVLGLAGAAALAALMSAAMALKQATTPPPRTDRFKDEDLPPWADNVAVIQDALAGKPFDDVLLSMRAREGDAFRIFIPYLFGETVVLMGKEANQWIFTEHDKVLDQALGGVVGTAVSGKKTMGTKERKETEAGKVFDKASVNFFSNRKALDRATQIFVDSSEDFCDQMEREIKPDENVFEKLWTYIIQTNADMLYGNGENAGKIVCRTISSINTEGLFSPEVKKAGDDLRTVLEDSYMDRIKHPETYADEDSMFTEFFRLSKGAADDDMLQGFQQFMLTLQLAANGNQLVTIRWLMSHVYADRRILDGVRAEVRAKLAEKGEKLGLEGPANIRDLQLDDLLDLNITNACITEAVRLHSDIPGKLTLRTAEEDLEYGSHQIPKGTTIFLYADAVHKDEKYFPEAASFCPFRYTEKKENKRKEIDREVVTFGHGRKRCTGELHARSQISALLASFVLRFDMDLVTDMADNSIPEDHDGPFVFDTANTLVLKNLRRRQDAPGEPVEAMSKCPVTRAANAAEGVRKQLVDAGS